MIMVSSLHRHKEEETYRGTVSCRAYYPRASIARRDLVSKSQKHAFGVRRGRKRRTGGSQSSHLMSVDLFDDEMVSFTCSPVALLVHASLFLTE